MADEGTQSPTIYSLIGGGILLYSIGLAIWLTGITLQSLPLLSWRWRAAGLCPWAILCLESVTIFMLTDWL